MIGDVSCIVEFFLAYLKKQGKKYKKQPRIYNTVTFNMADENIQRIISQRGYQISLSIQ